MEFFNATEIASIVAGSGAKWVLITIIVIYFQMMHSYLRRYFVFTSKHHDGFCNWPSTHTYGWNSMAVGAKRNVVGELSQAFRTRFPDVHFGLYYSLFEWFNPLYLADKQSQFSARYQINCPNF